MKQEKTCRTCKHYEMAIPKLPERCLKCGYGDGCYMWEPIETADPLLKDMRREISTIKVLNKALERACEYYNDMNCDGAVI